MKNQRFMVLLKYIMICCVFGEWDSMRWMVVRRWKGFLSRFDIKNHSVCAGGNSFEMWIWLMLKWDATAFYIIFDGWEFIRNKKWLENLFKMNERNNKKLSINILFVLSWLIFFSIFFFFLGLSLFLILNRIEWARLYLNLK